MSSNQALHSLLFLFADIKSGCYAEEEPEAEVDLTNLFARVAALDSTKSSAPGSTDAAELQRIEDDVDTSLAYLHARQHERERGKGRGEDEMLQQRNVKRVEMSLEEQRVAKEEMELMQKEREKAEALRGESCKIRTG